MMRLDEVISFNLAFASMFGTSFFFTLQGAQSTWSMLFALALQLEDGFVRQLLIGIEVVSQLETFLAQIVSS